MPRFHTHSGGGSWPGARWGTFIFGRCNLDHGVVDAPGNSPQSPSYAALVVALGCRASAKGFVDLTRQPKVVQQNSKPAGNTYDSSLSGCFATGGLCQSPSAQIAVGTSVAQDVLRSIDQKQAQETVACLGDSECG